MFDLENPNLGTENYKEKKVVAHCYECGNEILEDENYYYIEKHNICQNCIMEYIDEKFLIEGEEENG